jgi:hypothetical protein
VVGASAERLPQQADLTRGRPHQAGQEPQQCRLASPVWADDRQGLTRPERQIYPVEDADSAEAPMESASFEQECAVM